MIRQGHHFRRIRYHQMRSTHLQHGTAWSCMARRSIASGPVQDRALIYRLESPVYSGSGIPARIPLVVLYSRYHSRGSGFFSIQALHKSITAFAAFVSCFSPRIDEANLRFFRNGWCPLPGLIPHRYHFCVLVLPASLVAGLLIPALWLAGLVSTG